MIVSELIKVLESLNPDLMVIISGYEGGAKEVNYVDVERIALDVNEEWYYGKHEILHDGDEGYPGHKIIQAVRIV